MTSTRSLSLVPCQRLAESLARAPSLLSSLPPALFVKLQHSVDMVAGMEINLTDKQRNTTCGKSKVDQLKSRHISGESQGRHLYDSCVSALGFLENQLFGEMEEAGEEVTAMLSAARSAHGCKDLVKAVHGLTNTLVPFLEKAADRYHECNLESQRSAVLSQADLARWLLPVLLETAREALRHPNSSSIKAARDVYFSRIEDAVRGIIDGFRKSSADETAGQALADMDQLFHLTESGTIDDLLEIEELVERVLRQSLAVAKTSNPEDDEEISLACKRLLTDFSNIKKEQEESFRCLLGPLELLEQKVNGALLRIAINTLSNPTSPLDSLLSAALNSSLPSSARTRNDLEEKVRAFDDQAEQVVQLCHFCRTLTSSQDLAQNFLSLAGVLETIEPDLVPSVLQLYLKPDDVSNRKAASISRGLWRRVLEELGSLVHQLVDPAAYMVILAEEAGRLGRQFKDLLYSQAGALDALLGRLVAMAETGVDLSWRGLGNSAPLAENHALVKAERSVWEVRAARRLLADNLEDLSVHQVALRRVQVLVTALGDLVSTFSEKEDDQENEDERLLASLSGSSGHGLLHFRAQNHLDQTAAVAEESRREIYRLVHDLTAYSPSRNGTVAPRASIRGSRRARRSYTRLDTVLGQLSRLSHSLSESHNLSKPESLAEENPEERLHHADSKAKEEAHTKSLCAGPTRREHKHLHSLSLTNTSLERRERPKNLPLKTQHNIKLHSSSGPNVSLRRQLLLGGLEEELV